MGSLGYIVDKLKKAVSKNVVVHYVIDISSEHLQITEMASTRKTNDHFIAWNRIQKIVLFKQDCITVDQIRALVIIDDESSFELREDLDIGWKDFIHEIPNHLEGCETEDQWFQAVAFPAFELCERTIYERNLNVCP